VVDEICQILTDEQFMGKMVVVLAGYEAQIEALLAVNPGLKRLVFAASGWSSQTSAPPTRRGCWRRSWTAAVAWAWTLTPSSSCRSSCSRCGAWHGTAAQPLPHLS
jgi:hypothetical protein